MADKVPRYRRIVGWRHVYEDDPYTLAAIFWLTLSVTFVVLLVLSSVVPVDEHRDVDPTTNVTGQWLGDYNESACWNTANVTFGEGYTESVSVRNYSGDWGVLSWTILLNNSVTNSVQQYIVEAFGVGNETVNLAYPGLSSLRACWIGQQPEGFPYAVVSVVQRWSAPIW